MGVVTQQFGDQATYHLTSTFITVPIPDTTLGPILYYNQTDLTGLSAGDVLCTSKGWAWPYSLTITLSDAASSDLAVDLTVVGVDHFGNDKTETITGLADGIVQSATVWKFIYSVTLDSISNGAAGDSLQLGVRGAAASDTAGVEPGVFALPLSVKASGDVLAMVSANTDRLANGAMSIDYDASTTTWATPYNTSQTVMFIGLKPTMPHLT